MKLSRNILFNYLSITLAIVSIALAVYFFNKSKIYKELHVIPIADLSVVEIKEPVPDLRIFHKDREIKQLYVVTFDIENSGKVDIVAEDMKTDLQCSAGAEIVDAKIISRTPDDCDLQILKFKGQKVFFKSDLFKAGEKATVKLYLLSEPQLDFSTNRIVNLRGIVIDKTRGSYWGAGIAFVSAGVSFIITAILVFYFPPKFRTSITIESTKFSNALPSELSNFLGDEVVSDIHQVKIVIANTGRSEIRPAQFRSPILLNTGVKIISANWSSSVNVTMHKNCVEIMPFLIRPSELFTLSALVSGKPYVSIETNIKGTTEIHKSNTIVEQLNTAESQGGARIPT